MRPSTPRGREAYPACHGATHQRAETYVDNLNCVVICSAVRLPSGKHGRRIISISEIISYDPVNNSFSFVEIFRWNPIEDIFEFTGFMNSYLLEQRIAPQRGISEKNRRQIYPEVDRRAALLQKLGEQGVSNFYELYRLLSKASRQGLFLGSTKGRAPKGSSERADTSLEVAPHAGDRE